jgi:hypothetical protein
MCRPSISRVTPYPADLADWIAGGLSATPKLTGESGGLAEKSGYRTRFSPKTSLLNEVR